MRCSVLQQVSTTVAHGGGRTFLASLRMATALASSRMLPCEDESTCRIWSSISLSLRLLSADVTTCGR